MTGQGQFSMVVYVACLEEVTFGEKHEEVRESRCLNSRQREEPGRGPNMGAAQRSSDRTRGSEWLSGGGQGS